MTDRTRGKKPLVLPVQNPESILRKPATPKPAVPKPTPAQIPDCTDFGHLAWHRRDRDKFTNNNLTLNQAGEVVNRACAQQPCPNRLKYPPPEIVEKIEFQWQYCSNENYREVEQEYKLVEPFAPTSPVASASSTKPITSPPVEPTAPATPVAPTPVAPKPPANNPPSDPPSSPEPESPPAPPPAPLPCRSPPAPQPPNPPSDNGDGPESEEDSSDDDDDMSKVRKAFEGIAKLESNGSNWAIFIHRVTSAGAALGKKYARIVNEDADHTDIDADADKELQHAISLLIPDTIYYHYLTIESTPKFLEQLQADFNVSNIITEARSISKLFTL